MIGDGMGDGAIQAASLRSGTLHMQRMPVRGRVETANAFGRITDSGASATAYATATSTYNGAIGMGPDSLPRRSIVEIAEERGMATALVASSAITHATPAAFLAHVVDRDDQDEIARQMVSSGVDVALGGGWKYFDSAHRSDGADLVAELHGLGYSVVRTGSELEQQALSGSRNLFGLFADDALPAAISRDPGLAEMTEAALESVMHDPDGFFLMVEGSQIDWAAHENDLEWLISEVLDFDRAVSVVLTLVGSRPNTLVIVTADHETGGVMASRGRTDAVGLRWGGTGHTADPVPIFMIGEKALLGDSILTNASVGLILRRAINGDESRR